MNDNFADNHSKDQTFQRSPEWRLLCKGSIKLQTCKLSLFHTTPYNLKVQNKKTRELKVILSNSMNFMEGKFINQQHDKLPIIFSFSSQ
jgi:hypothetical protein